MKNNITIGLLSLVVIILGLFLVFRKAPTKTIIVTEIASSTSPVNTPATSSVASVVPEVQTPSYAYLFKEQREANTSNIVGYFGGGAFAWYVPDWLAENWIIPTPKFSEVMNMAPKIRDNPEDFSDIVFDVASSTETFNAATLYEAEASSTEPSALINQEVVLNKHTEGGLMLVIETDTHIYHIQKSVQDRIKDIYYIDGNGKTLMVTFDARADIFPQFSAKIRNLVEGIGEVKAPQG